MCGNEGESELCGESFFFEVFLVLCFSSVLLWSLLFAFNFCCLLLLLL